MVEKVEGDEWRWSKRINDISQQYHSLKQKQNLKENQEADISCISVESRILDIAGGDYTLQEGISAVWIVSVSGVQSR